MKLNDLIEMLQKICGKSANDVPVYITFDDSEDGDLVLIPIHEVFKSSYGDYVIIR